MFLEEGCHGALLVFRDWIHVAESTAGGEVHGVGVPGWIEDCAFGLVDSLSGVDFCGAYVCYVGARVGPLMRKISCWRTENRICVVYRT